MLPFLTELTSAQTFPRNDELPISQVETRYEFSIIMHDNKTKQKDLPGELIALIFYQ